MPRLVLCAILFAPVCLAAIDEIEIREHAQRSVNLLQKVAAQWKSPCFSCHHQTMPAMAIEAARAHGLTVDEVAAQAAAQKTFRYLSDLDAAVRVDALIDPAVSEGYGLLGAHASHVEPNLSTATYARHIARAQRADGHWATFDARPPHSAGLFVATAVGARAVSLYTPVQMGNEKREALERARKWLASAQPASTEDLTYRLLGLHWTGASSEDQLAAARDLVAAQRADGGWSQVTALNESDAYSTAQALVALRRAGGWERSHADFQRGAAWLAKSQAADGSWHVRTRIHTPAPASPPYFESGFPYGRDQFISCAATAWAVMALAEALPVASPVSKALPLSGVKPMQAAAWMETALFGAAGDMTAFDPRAATVQGTTALMMAADQPAKVRALIKRGASVRATAKSGYDALMIASLFPNNRETLQLLIAAGVSAKARPGVRFKASALPIAAFHGDAEMVSFLIDKGADPNLPFMALGQFPASPLSIATQLDDAEVVRTLAAKGAKLDIKDDNGMTDLSWAALLHKDAALKALIDLGSDKRVKDKFGLTPVDHTRAISHSSALTGRLLEQ